ncbi:PGG domain [Sesbania bispinosa]|nr:PGG domain [Sesbania bispinosa]
MNTMNDDRMKIAAQEGDINLLYTLIQEDPYVLERIDSIPFVETPLHIAASFGNLQFATEIMRLKPFAWKLNQQGFSPIHLAMDHGQKRMVLRFVDMDNNLVRVKGREGFTPLHFASQTGDIDLLSNFLSACPDSIEDVTVRSETALHIAVKNQQYKALQVLVGWLKRTRQRGAMQLEKIILNWKDEAGNTVLHISTLINDSQALQLLVKTKKMDLKAKNLENSTALDIAGSAEIKSILVKAKAKHGSSVTSAPTLSDKLRSKITVMDKVLIFILRIRNGISEDQRNAYLIVAALVATATYQSTLSPPGGVYQANAGDNNNVTTTTSLNSNATAIPQGNAGKSVLSGVGRMLLMPMSMFIISYLASLKLISPTPSTIFFSSFLSSLFYLFFFWASFAIDRVYKRLQGSAKNREIHTRNNTGGNRW